MFGAAAVLFVMLGCDGCADQSRRSTETALVVSGAQELAAGWAALAAGRPAEAETAADTLLQRGTARHEALALKIRARVQSARPDAGLDAYEQWLQGSPQEDVFLLQPIARGVLEGLTRAGDAAVRIHALQALASAGDRGAAGRLGELAASEPSAMADEALARIGDPGAVGRLKQQLADPGRRPDVSSTIDALVKAKASDAATAIGAALEPTRPLPTRIAAARALADLDARTSIPLLKRALTDPDPPVRIVAAASLARMGDQSGAALLQQMEKSPSAEVRLMLAEIAALGSPTGSWVEVARTALGDVDPSARLRAAELLIKHSSEPQVGMRALGEALADTNPAMRLAAARVLEEVPPPVLAMDLPSLRKLLRDSAPEVRIQAGEALLRLAGGAD